LLVIGCAGAVQWFGEQFTKFECTGPIRAIVLSGCAGAVQWFSEQFTKFECTGPEQEQLQYQVALELFSGLVSNSLDWSAQDLNKSNYCIGLRWSCSVV